MSNPNLNQITRILIFITCTLFLTLKTNAQEVRVIDNKGTIAAIRNNTVTTSTTAPALPLENDVWSDTTTSTIKIWNGSAWLNLSSSGSHTGTPGSVFFADTDGTPIENNGQFFWDNTLNRLSLGTPLAGSNKLTVQGAIRATATNNADGTFGQPSYRFSNDSDTGMYRIGTNQLGFSTGGVNALSIDNTQNVSIGKNLTVTGSYIDSSGDPGNAGQVLSSTVTGTDWINSASGGGNTVTTSITTPTVPLEGDVWFDTSDTNHTSTKIYDGATWVEFSPIKAARIFYPPSIAIDVSALSAIPTAPGDETKDLYLEYFNQFNTPSVASAGAPSAIPTYARTDLYYYVTYYDPAIFSNVSIDANGVMTYDVIFVPLNDNTIINVVFVVK